MYSCEGEVVYFVFQRTRLPFFKAQIKNLCPRQGTKIAGVVLNRVGIFGFFSSKQGQGLRPSATHLHPNIGRVPTPAPPGENPIFSLSRSCYCLWMAMKCLAQRASLFF